MHIAWSKLTTEQVDNMVTTLLADTSRRGRRTLARCIQEQRKRHGTAPMRWHQDIFPRLPTAQQTARKER